MATPTHTWHAVDMKTGRRGPEIQMQVRGKVTRIIGEPTDTQGAFLCWNADPGVAGSYREVPDWRQWTEPGKMMLVLVDALDRPLWGGVILRRVTDETPWVQVTLASLEHYADRRYVVYWPYFNVDQAQIAKKMILDISDEVSGVSFDVDEVNTGVIRTRTYLDSDDKTTLAALQDLMNLENGLEFTVDLEWDDAGHTQLNRIWRFRTRIGRSLDLPTRFEHPGSVVGFKVNESYAKGDGANDVMAFSTGEGDARPQSVHATDTQRIYDTGWARYEERWSPSSSITEQATLDSYAYARYNEMVDGLTDMNIVLHLDTGPQVNVDWWLGDDIMVALTAPAFPVRRGPDNELRPGYERTVRVVGYDIDLDARTLTPYLREF